MSLREKVLMNSKPKWKDAKNGFCDDVFPFSIEFFQKKKNVWYMCDI